MFSEGWVTPNSTVCNDILFYTKMLESGIDAKFIHFWKRRLYLPILTVSNSKVTTRFQRKMSMPFFFYVIMEKAVWYSWNMCLIYGQQGMGHSLCCLGFSLRHHLLPMLSLFQLTSDIFCSLNVEYYLSFRNFEAYFFFCLYFLLFLNLTSCYSSF